MSTILKNCSRGLLTLAILGGVSCGGNSTNNDQGTSFLARGYFDDVEADTGVTGLIVPLFTDLPTIGTGAGLADGNQVIVFMQVENRLTSQFVRVDRIECDYDIPGSTLSVPSDSFTMGAVLSEASLNEEGTGAEDESSTGTLGFQMLSPDVISYINNNANSLPQLPFRMNAFCRAVGQSQAGDVFTTNDLNFTIQFVDIAEFSGGGTTPRFQVGPGTGGDIETFGGEEGAGTGAIGAGELGADENVEEATTEEEANVEENNGEELIEAP